MMVHVSHRAQRALSVKRKTKTERIEHSRFSPQTTPTSFKAFYKSLIHYETTKCTKSLRHHRHPSPGNHIRRFELTLSAGGGRTRNPRGNCPRPFSTGRTLPLSFSSDLRRSSLWINVEAPRLPAAFFKRPPESGPRQMQHRRSNHI